MSSWNETRRHSGDIRAGGCLSATAGVDGTAVTMSCNVWYAAWTISLCYTHVNTQPLLADIIKQSH